MCIQNKHEIEALAVGLTLVGKGRNAVYRLYRFNQCGHEQELRTIRVRNNNFKCHQCVSDKFEKEALDVGLTLIGKGRNVHHRLYSFNQCGHEQEIAICSVRKNEFKCNQCLSDKLEKEALDVGLTLIGDGRNINFRLYRFDQCGHEQEMQPSNVRNNAFKCNECIQNKHEIEALKVGLTLIGTGLNSQYRLYRFNQCGHEQEITIDSVRKNNFKCNECIQNKHEIEALKVGLTLIGKGRNKNYRLYRFDQCGHEQEMTISGVRNNSFDCHQCGESMWTKESGLYSLLITDKGKSWFKVGNARDVDTRIKQYGLSDTATVDIDYFIKIKDRLTATTVENFIQNKKLKPYQLPPEEMKGYMKSGFTECYSLEAVDLIKTIFSKVEVKFN